MKEIVFTVPGKQSRHENATLLTDSNYLGDAEITFGSATFHGELHELTRHEMYDFDLPQGNELGLLLRERARTKDGQDCWAYLA